MPRRAPGEVRAQLDQRDSRHHRRTIIRGLSASTNRQLGDFERQRGLTKGDVALAFQRWSSRARRSRNAEEWRYGAVDFFTGHIRSSLEAALRSLRPRAQRELRAALEPIDALVLRRTVHDPFAAPWHPWWWRRIEI